MSRTVVPAAATAVFLAAASAAFAPVAPAPVGGAPGYPLAAFCHG